MRSGTAGDPSRMIWLLSGLLMVSGYALVVHPLQSAIADAAAQRALIDQRVRSEEAALQRFDEMKRVQLAMRRDLRGVAIPHSEGEAAAHLLTHLTAAAVANRVDITSVAPQAPPSAAVDIKRLGRLMHFDSMQLLVRGRYVDVIEFIRSSSLMPARLA